MKTLYLDLGMGAAGDMLTSALAGLLTEDERASFIKEINDAGIPGAKCCLKEDKRCGIKGLRYIVAVDGVIEGEEPDHSHDHEHHDHGHHDEHHDHDHHHEHHHHDHDHEHHDHEHHHHSSLAQIEEIIDSLKLKEKVKEDIKNVYRILAEAEAFVHGTEVSHIHFHEVGTMDAIADIAGACLAMDRIGPVRVTASPVNVGGGKVRCAHGILPVPAPAAARILTDVPVYEGDIRSELCTPTGAALIKYFADDFGKMPLIKAEAYGYGLGKKEFEEANILRAVLGAEDEKSDEIWEVSCNVDDMTGEDIAFAAKMLLEDKALDVYTVPISMKKSRPGTLICVMCREEDQERITDLLFKYTTTIGVRKHVSERTVLKREEKEIDTPCGLIRYKISSGGGFKRIKIEHDDLEALAKERNISVEDARLLVSDYIDTEE